MTIQSLQLDPNATALTNEDHITAINAASTNISRVGSVDAAARPLVAGEVSNTELASTAAKDNLDGLADTARGYIKTNPVSGEFPVVALQRDASFNLDVEFDDVAII